MKKIIIAIDGHSSCGKSTMAKLLARKIGYIYVDTGAMYRSVTLFAMQHGMFDATGTLDEECLKTALNQINITFRLNAETGKPETYLNGELVENTIRSVEVSSYVSKVAAVPFVRAKLVAIQQQMGEEKGIVMDGRDIGTVVFPNAEMKVFVTAKADVRARRRFDELQAKGMKADYDEILHNVQERDYLDSHRAVSPLRKADDAVELDNSTMSIEEQNEWLLHLYQQRATE